LPAAGSAAWATALSLQELGIRAEIYEQASQLREVGGINLLPRLCRSNKPISHYVPNDQRGGRMNNNSEVTLEIMKRFNGAFEAHRPENLDDLIGEGCVLENTAPAPDGARYEGREACLTFWKGIASSANLVFEAEEIWAREDRGVIRWKLRWGERDTDRIRGVNVMRVRGGKIVEALGYVKG
jgi:hypothetical protein